MSSHELLSPPNSRFLFNYGFPDTLTLNTGINNETEAFLSHRYALELRVVYVSMSLPFSTLNQYSFEGLHYIRTQVDDCQFRAVHAREK